MQNALLAATLCTLMTGWKPFAGAPDAGAAEKPGAPQWVRSEVYFGLSVPGGGQVTPAQWQDFVDREISPRFPAGFSIIETAGQWRDASGRITREPGRLLVLMHPGDPATAASVEQIRKGYCKQFHQEAVMKVESATRVSF